MARSFEFNFQVSQLDIFEIYIMASILQIYFRQSVVIVVIDQFIVEVQVNGSFWISHLNFDIELFSLDRIEPSHSVWKSLKKSQFFKNSEALNYSNFCAFCFDLPKLIHSTADFYQNSPHYVKQDKIAFSWFL